PRPAQQHQGADLHLGRSHRLLEDRVQPLRPLPDARCRRGDPIAMPRSSSKILLHRAALSPLALVRLPALLSLLRLPALLRLLTLLSLLSVIACTPHHTGPTEVGAVFNKLTHSLEIKPAGATYFFLPFVNDLNTYDISQRSLVLNADLSSGNRREKDDLRFKTRDGNDVDTDVTVRWRIDPSRIGAIWRNVALSLAAGERLPVRR